MSDVSSKLPPNIRDYYFESDRLRMVWLLILGGLVPFFLAVEGAITSFDPIFVVNYNFLLTALVAGAAFVTHRSKDYRTLDRFSWAIILVLIPVILYLRYTGFLDETRKETISVGFLLDIFIIFISYTALSISPFKKAVGTSVFVVGVLLIYAVNIEEIPDELAGFTTIVIAYLAASLLGYGNATLIASTRLVAFQSLNKEKVLNSELNLKNEELSQALDKVNALSGMLPICANCKKIRNDDGYYQQIEHFISEHSEVEFTHGICPECSNLLFPKVDAD